ncbi:MAG: adenylosuccinate lyase [Chloroflexi bacterium]|nr:adenylosuccinate lyase [Chloroflexota bacterium]
MAGSGESFTHRDYLSPFTWRYGSTELRRIWSEEHYRLLWRRIWVALAREQHRFGLVTAEELQDIEAHVEEIDLERAHAIERETRHDVMAEIRTFAEQAPAGGGKIHLGATSADIEDNADVLRERESLNVIAKKVEGLLSDLAALIERYARTVCMAYTHLQPAEPTTLGYRLALYAQDFLIDLQQLHWLTSSLRGKGLKGAVGTAASYAFLLEGRDGGASALEEGVLNRLGLPAFLIDGQTYPRKQDVLVINTLAGIAQSAYRFAFDVRVLQSPGFGEVAEPFGASQVGSSAMPFKRNPRTMERVCSLARYVMALPAVAYGNAAHSLLERTLDDSAARRLVFPEAFLAVDEVLIGLRYVVSHLDVDRGALQRNLDRFGPFAGTERLLMAWVQQRGFSRQELHELIRHAALEAWDALQEGKPNPLVDRIAVRALESGQFKESYPTVRAEVARLLDPSGHVGTAPERALAFVTQLRAQLAAGSVAEEAQAPEF